MRNEWRDREKNSEDQKFRGKEKSSEGSKWMRQMGAVGEVMGK